MTNKSVIFGIVLLVVGAVLIFIEHQDDENPWKKIVAIVLAVLAWALSIASLFLSDIPQPVITFSKLDDGSYLATLECVDFSMGQIYYRINTHTGEPTRYEGSFPVEPGDTVSAYTCFLVDFRKSGESNETLDVDERVVRATVSFREGGTADLKFPAVLGGEIEIKQIPLSEERVAVINEEAVRLAISGGDLRALARRGDEVEFVVTTKDLPPAGVTELEILAGGRSLDYTFQDMVLYILHEERDPYAAVAERVESESAFELGTGEVIHGSVASVTGVIAIPLEGPAKVRTVNRGRSFSDVPASAWAEPAVNFASSHDIINGTDKGSFSPHDWMTRACLVVALHNLAGRPQAGSAAIPYSDVPGWCADAVAWAVEQEITGGVGGQLFGPNAPITREQLVLMLWRYAGEPPATSQGLGYTDLDEASSHAQIALCWAASEETGILYGTGTDAIEPKAKVTREEAAMMLMRFCEQRVGIKLSRT